MKTGKIYSFLRGGASTTASATRQRASVSAFGMLLGAVLLLASCVREPLTGGMSPVPEGKVRVELSTNAGDFTKPVSRAGKANEETVSNAPWVFVFNKTTGAFIEAAQAEYNSVTEKSYVILTATSSNVTLVVMANVPDSFVDDKGETHDFNDFAWGKPYDEMAMMLTAALDDPQNFVPYTPDQLIPMSGKIDLEKIDASTVINSTNTAGGGALKLHRIVAKVTVENSAAGFTFEGATVVGASRQGYLFPNTGAVTEDNENAETPLTTDYLAESPDDEVTGIAASSSTELGEGTTFAHPIYIYESEAGQTSVIIKGTYVGKTGYYRVAFKSRGNEGIDDGEIMDVRRNMWYKFKIISVNKAGHSTVAEALAAPMSNDAIVAEVAVIDLSSHDIIDNGEYYLGVSNSEFIAYAEDGDLEVELLTASTNIDRGILTPAYGMGAISFSDNTKLKLGNEGYGWSETSLGSVSSAKLNIILTSAFKAGDPAEYVVITCGSIQKKIKVSRRAPLEYTLSYVEFSENTESEGFYAGQIEYDSVRYGKVNWVWLLSDVASSQNEVKANGFIYVAVPQNDGLTRKGGIVYLSRASEAGRLKLYLEQLACPPISVAEANCYMMRTGDPSPILIPVSQLRYAMGTKPVPDNGFLGSGWIKDYSKLKAQVLWSDQYDVISDYGVVKNVSYNGAMSVEEGIITVYPGNSTGNAGIILYEDNDGVDGYQYSTAANADQIRWTWHIWRSSYYPYESDGTPNGMITGNQDLTNTKWMDRNLGALSGYQGYSDTKGLYYQWGRKDPFPCAYDWSVTAASFYFAPGSGIEFKYESTTYPQTDYHSMVEVPNGTEYNLSNSVLNPFFFYVPNKSWVTDDWYTGTKVNQNNDLWGGGTGTSAFLHAPAASDGNRKSVYDPCPPGYRVPLYGEWGTFDELTEDSTPSTSEAGWGDAMTFYYGRTNNDYGGFYPANATPSLWYNGIEGQCGYYWMSSIKVMDNNLYYGGYGFAFSPYNIIQDYGQPSSSFGIRCRKE